MTARIERTGFRDIQREHDVKQQSIAPCEQLHSKRFYLREHHKHIFIGWVENEDLRPKTQNRRPPQNHL